MPKHAEPAAVLCELLDGRERAIDAEHLVVLGELLDEAPLALLEGDKILDEVEEARRPAGSPDSVSRLTTPGSSSSSIASTREIFERRFRAAEHCLEAVGEDHEGVGVKTCGIVAR